MIGFFLRQESWTMILNKRELVQYEKRAWQAPACQKNGSGLLSAKIILYLLLQDLLYDLRSIILIEASDYVHPLPKIT